MATKPTFTSVDQADLDFLGREPIPAKYYHEADWYERERQAIFLRSWIEIGHVCELPQPGSFIRRELEFAGVSLLIVRGRDGEIRAFHNVCTHRGTQLTDQAEGRTSTFSCPYHRWTFGLDGALLSAPDFERFFTTKADCALPRVALDTCAGLIFVNLGAYPVPLREWLGELADELETLPVARATRFSEYVYDIAANWKLTYDNFQENYHLRFIHPRTGEATFSSENPFGYPVRYQFFGPHRTQTIWTNPEPRIAPLQRVAMGKAMIAAARRGLAGGPNGREYFALFPNFFILGTVAPHFSHVVYPLGPQRSRGVIRIYWEGDDADASERFAREYVMAMARDVHAEDRAVIEAGQRGLASGALKHIHFQTQEALCRHLIGAVRDAVDAHEAAAGAGA
ncbi:aromatic ring-hydroxylating dioxygenase subunit alpha [Novosphingobium flavum]|uniref:aromatic ring-hydroxylating oxygenase subunit alpha n=1 Tax=Novosphingobium aerophilum TaxID=2839843 RepID=UPI001639F97C|nr:aromatic ring-hydroxylating dioxygenase subunit alpha [Novosphingobium aerophilum]MBC2660336.1 aromatic ring-hydroxylating dioxygenase subunit alpha [Novosphingobium aerophilum]